MWTNLINGKKICWFFWKSLQKIKRLS
jgi:hypothetical protein